MPQEARFMVDILATLLNLFKIAHLVDGQHFMSMRVEN